MGKKKKSKAARKKAAANKSGGGNKESWHTLAEQLGSLAPDANIAERLASDNAHQRSMACAAIGVHLFQASKSQAVLLCRLLGEQGTLTRVLVLMGDSKGDVALAAARALRNFCLVGNTVACEQLVAKGGGERALLQTLCAVFSEASSPVQRSPDMLACVFAILASLCTHVLGEVELVTQNDVLQCAFKALEAAAADGDVELPTVLLALEAASFLFVVSEDNSDLARLILSTQGLVPNVIAKVMQNVAVLDSLRSACAGILFNVLAAASDDALNGSARVQLLSDVLATVGQAMQLDLVALASTMLVDLKDEKAKHEEKMAAKPDDPEFKDITMTEWGQVTEQKVFVWKQSAVCVTQMLEILTNLCTSEFSELSHEALAKEAILPKLATKAGLAGHAEQFDEQALQEQCLLALSPEETAVVRDFNRQSKLTAVTCMSNLILHLPSNVTGELSGVLNQAFQCIQGLEAAYGQSDEHAIKNVDAFTALVWNVARKQVAPSKAQLQILVNIARAPKSLETSVNVAGTLGAIGTLKEHFANNFVIGGVLLQVLESAGHLELACETVNSLIDVYTEDNVHTQQVNQLQLIPKLAASMSLIQALGNSHEQKDDVQLLERAQETLENIEAFVNYKPNHI